MPTVIHMHLPKMEHLLGSVTEWSFQIIPFTFITHMDFGHESNDSPSIKIEFLVLGRWHNKYSLSLEEASSSLY